MALLKVGMIIIVKIDSRFSIHQAVTMKEKFFPGPITDLPYNPEN